MEKLIELLNERMKEKEKNWPKLARFTSYDWINKVFSLNNGCHFWVEFVLSKRFKFIKWLIDNDKINRSKVLISFSMAEFDGLWNMYCHWIDDDWRLLMILTVQDNPTEYLVSILK